MTLVGAHAMTFADADLRRLAEGYPSGALTEFTIPGPWQVPRRRRRSPRSLPLPPRPPRRRRRRSTLILHDGLAASRNSSSPDDRSRHRTLCTRPRTHARIPAPARRSYRRSARLSCLGPRRPEPSRSTALARQRRSGPRHRVAQPGARRRLLADRSPPTRRSRHDWPACTSAPTLSRADDPADLSPSIPFDIAPDQRLRRPLPRTTEPATSRSQSCTAPCAAWSRPARPAASC